MTTASLETRIRNAWLGRVSGCMLGKPVEILSMRQGHDALTDYLTTAGAAELRLATGGGMYSSRISS